MSPQSQYVVSLYRNANLTKNQCRHNIGFPQGLHKSFFFINSLAQIQLELEILRNSSAIFGGSHRRCSVKILFSKEFVILKGKHSCGGIFFIKFAGLQASDCFKKGSQHRYFLMNIRKFIKAPILKNICKRLFLHFWKLLCENILYSFVTCLTAYH